MIIQGFKDIENRNWRSWHRGPLLIHTSKTWDRDGALWICETFPFLEKAVSLSKSYRGGIIGTVKMVDCVDSHDSDWFFGKWGFVFTDPVETEFVSHHGKLGIFDIPGFNPERYRIVKSKDAAGNIGN